MSAAALYVPALLGGYLATTFTLWFAHWFSHRRGGPLTGFHVRGHHALYPSGAACLADTFRYGVGWHDSVYAFLPWLGLLAGAIWWWLPASVAIVVTLEAVVIVGLWSYVHEQFHLDGSRLETRTGFVRARGRHFRHHDRGVNFAVYDHFWDRVFRTFDA
jgi:sterol desaturase/sphingolipid hydroxylase (fatty acid hydroxylase superfamily)